MRPDLRTPPFRESVYAKLVHTVLTARARENKLGETIVGLDVGEIALLLADGGKKNSTKLLNPWREGTSKEKVGKKTADDNEEEHDSEGEDDADKPGFVPSMLYLAFKQEGIIARKKLVRGIYMFICIIYVYMYINMY